MSETTTPVSKDSPLWLAWEAYTATEEYANTKRWAVVPEHAEGSLWAAFERGFAAQSTPSPIAGKADEMPDFVKGDLDEIFWKHSPVTPTRTIRWLADDRERLLARVEDLEQRLRIIAVLMGEPDPIPYVPTRWTTDSATEDTNASR